MPYVKQEIRDRLEPEMRKLLEKLRCEEIGAYAYVEYKLAVDAVHGRGLSFGALAAVYGMLTCVADEFYARLVVPYEKKKRIENGDVERQ